MNPDYINGYGYILLVMNIATLSICIFNVVFWVSMCIYDTDKPRFYNFMLLMLLASICSVIANAFALARMFDSFLIAKLIIGRSIITTTIIDRLGMACTFFTCMIAGFVFKKIRCD